MKKKEIFEYLKNNLSLEIDEENNYWEDYKFSFKLKLEDEIISEDYIYVDKQKD